MWLAENMKHTAPAADAEQGVSTIVGEQMGVVTRGEVRQLPVYGPGGYVWMPESGASVLVIKGGPGGEEQCVCGQKQPAARLQRNCWRNFRRFSRKTGKSRWTCR